MLIADADIHRVYAEVTAKDFDGLARYLADLIANMAAGGAEFTAILAPVTDLSMVFTESNAGFPMIDCARVHIDAIVRRMLN